MFEYNGSTWVKAAGGVSGDVVVSDGIMRKGDYAGAWLFNELRAVINCTTRSVTSNVVPPLNTRGIAMSSGTPATGSTPEVAYTGAAAKYATANGDSQSPVARSTFTLSSDTWSGSIGRVSTPLLVYCPWVSRGALVPKAEIQCFANPSYYSQTIGTTWVDDDCGDSVVFGQWQAYGEVVTRDAGAIASNPVHNTFAPNVSVPPSPHGFTSGKNHGWNLQYSALAVCNFAIRTAFSTRLQGPEISR